MYEASKDRSTKIDFDYPRVYIPLSMSYYYRKNPSSPNSDSQSSPTIQIEDIITTTTVTRGWKRGQKRLSTSSLTLIAAFVAGEVLETVGRGVKGVTFLGVEEVGE